MKLNPKNTALILIDLQNGIAGLKLAPYTGEQVVANGARLAASLREKGGVVIYVRVDLANMQTIPVDSPTRDPNGPPPPLEASELVSECGYQIGDHLITKRQWGAFFGTDLEARLRELQVETVVIGGIATNFGVESTARASAGLGFPTIVVEDATSSVDADIHRFAYEVIFPRLCQVRSTQQILEALA